MIAKNGHVLGDVASFVRGITFTPEDVKLPFEDGTAVCMRTKNVQVDLDEDDLIAVPKEFVRRKEQYLSEGDLLVSSANSWNLVGKCCWVPKLDYEATAGGFISILRADREKVYPRYLYHWFAAPQTQHEVRLCGRQTTNISNLNYERCLNLPIPLPMLEEQKRIAAILDKADTIRRKRQEAREVADSFLKASYMHVFGSPVTNPRDWPIEPLGNYLDFLTSGSRGWAQYYVPDGKRFIRSLDVQMNRIGATDSVYVDPPAGTEADRTRVRPRDVLLTITGSCIGRVAFVPPDIHEAYVSQHVAILRLKKGLMDRYVSMYLSLDSGGQRQIAKDQYGQTRPGLSLAQIRKFEIPVPPLSEQKRFLAIWDRFTQVHNGMTTADCEVDDLFDSLVQRAFKGEL